MISISEEDGYLEKTTEGVSSLLFTKDNKIFKINKRLTLERQTSDLIRLKKELCEFIEHIPYSEVDMCTHRGEAYTCVIQPVIKGKEIKYLPRLGVEEALKKNKEFILKLLDFFFSSIKNKDLYPDIVGFPNDPSFFNSLNLILEEETGKIILCDVNLSPHEDTIKKYGQSFYDSDNVKIYLEKMSEISQFLEN